MLLKRLDRFYVGHWAISCGGLVSIWPSMTLLDYAPVSLCLELRSSSAPRRGSRILNSVLDDASLIQFLASLWFRDPGVHIDPGSFLERCILASSERCRTTAMQRRLMLYGRERVGGLTFMYSEAS